MKMFFLFAKSYLFIICFLCLFISSNLYAGVFTEDNDALKRGARFYMDYCSGCHELREFRVGQFLVDLDVNLKSPRKVQLVLSQMGLRVNDLTFPFKSSMPAASAKKWFGVVPPDLSFAMTQFGSTWMRHYLKAFYPDPARAMGCNNSLVPNIAMPNALESLINKTDQLSAENFDRALDDMLAFLNYVADPSAVERRQIGVGVMIFLALLMFVALKLNRVRKF